jgi:hypothetical protein
MCVCVRIMATHRSLLQSLCFLEQRLNLVCRPPVILTARYSDLESEYSKVVSIHTEDRESAGSSFSGFVMSKTDYSKAVLYRTIGEKTFECTSTAEAIKKFMEKSKNTSNPIKYSFNDGERNVRLLNKTQDFTLTFKETEFIVNTTANDPMSHPLFRSFSGRNPDKHTEDPRNNPFMHPPDKALNPNPDT